MEMDMESTFNSNQHFPYSLITTIWNLTENYCFQMELHIQFHTKFQIPCCFPSYIKLGNMDGSIEKES